MSAVNAKAAFFFLKEAGKHVNDNGKICTLVTSLLGAYTPFYSAYAGTKAPVEHFTRAASKEFGERGISVTAIGPGPDGYAVLLSCRRPPMRVAYRKAPLAFTGHTDTVPLGLKPWSVPTHDGLIKDGKVWGRGSCDMKGGVAAFVVAAIEMAPRLAGTPGVVLYITAGEETGLAGAMKLAERDMKGEAGALVVAEPTSNRPLCGHKGAMWLKAITHGVTAHGSMPDQGVNAVYSAARAVSSSRRSISTWRGIRSWATTLNVGSLPAVSTSTRYRIARRSASTFALCRVWTMGDCVTSSRAFSGRRSSSRRWSTSRACGPIRTIRGCASCSRSARKSAAFPSKVESAPYITDASALTPALGGVPTTILGPGPAHLADQTDEWCEIERIEEAQRIYERLIANWCGLL